jgi:hypothetical protein
MNSSIITAAPMTATATNVTISHVRLALLPAAVLDIDEQPIDADDPAWVLVPQAPTRWPRPPCAMIEEQSSDKRASGLASNQKSTDLDSSPDRLLTSAEPAGIELHDGLDVAGSARAHTAAARNADDGSGAGVTWVAGITGIHLHEDNLGGVARDHRAVLADLARDDH